MEKKELFERTKFNIRIKLYPLIKLTIESGYHIKRSVNGVGTRLVFKDREKTIEDVLKEIERFSRESKEPVSLVKDYLLNLLDSSKNEKPLFIQEYNEIESIICLNASQEERQ